AALARDPARERRGLDALAFLAERRLWLGPVGDLRGRLLGGLLGPLLRGRRGGDLAVAGHVRDGLALLADEGDRRPDGHLALGDGDLQQDAGRLGLDLLRDLVRVEFVERIALLHGVAFGLQPLDDRPRLHSLPEPRDLDLSRHFSPRSLVWRRARRRHAGRRTAPSPARTGSG